MNHHPINLRVIWLFLSSSQIGAKNIIPKFTDQFLPKKTTPWKTRFWGQKRDRFRVVSFFCSILKMKPQGNPDVLSMTYPWLFWEGWESTAFVSRFRKLQRPKATKTTATTKKTWYNPLKTNECPLKRFHFRRNVVFQSLFRGELLISGQL